MQVEIEESLHNIAWQSGAIEECGVHSDQFKRSFDDDAEKKACIEFSEEFSDRIEKEDAYKMMRDFIDLSEEDCARCMR